MGFCAGSSILNAQACDGDFDTFFQQKKSCFQWKFHWISLFFKAPGAFILRDPGPESSLSPIEHD